MYIRSSLGSRPSLFTIYVRVLIVRGQPTRWKPTQNEKVNGKQGRPGTEAIIEVCILLHVYIPCSGG